MINKTDWRVFNIIFQLQKKENQDLENEHLLEKYQENNVDIAESITNILKFVGNLRKIIESSKVQDRRCIFGILLSNSVISDKKCLFSLAKPFCEICRNQEKSHWLERTEYSQVFEQPRKPELFVILSCKSGYKFTTTLFS